MFLVIIPTDDGTRIFAAMFSLLRHSFSLAFLAWFLRFVAPYCYVILAIPEERCSGFEVGTYAKFLGGRILISFQSPPLVAMFGPSRGLGEENF